VASKLVATKRESGAVLQGGSVMSAAEIDLVGRVQSALAASGVSSLRDLTVELVDEKLCLSGVVGSFYHKQLAQETVRTVNGVVEILNSVRVIDTEN